MRKVLIVNFLILFCTISCAAQKNNLEGKFCNSKYTQDYATCFEFKENGRFSYRSGGDMGGDEVGSGKYYKKDKSLILNYEKRNLYNLSYHKASQSITRNDSITYHFNVRNLDGKPISNTVILYKDFSSSKSHWFTLDEDAEGFLNFDRAPNDSIEFRFSYIGYNFYTIELRKDYNYYIDVFLTKDGQEMPIDQHTETLEIITLKNNFLKLKNKKGIVTEWFNRE